MARFHTFSNRGGIELSCDDGSSWQRVFALPAKDNTVYALIPPVSRGCDAVSTRVTASDRDGNKIQQTIRSAWRVRW